MDHAELRHLVAEILDEEERPGGDWSRVVALSDALAERLRHELETECPDAVYHYLDDSDIRQKDGKYALWQRSLVREYAATGAMVEHAPSVEVPWWGCILAVLVPLAIVAWLFLG